MNIDCFLLFDGIYLIHLLLKALHLMEFGIIFLKFKSSIKSVLDLVEIRFKFVVFFGAFVQSNQSYQWHQINTKLSLDSNWYICTKKSTNRLPYALGTLQRTVGHEMAYDPNE